MKPRFLHPSAALSVAIALAPCAIAEEKAKDMTMGASSPRADEHARHHLAENEKLIARIRPASDSKVQGTVVFEKIANGVKVTAKIGGFEPGSTHAIHIHEFGDLGSPDAKSAGEHFNPDGHPHGKPGDPERHAGDLGEFKADSDGNASYEVTVDNLTLDTGKHGILGRAVIIHEKGDDGSEPSGNAGARIGAGVIGISKDSMDGDHDEAMDPKDKDAAPTEDERSSGPDVTSPGTPTSEGVQVDPDEQP